MSSPSHEPPPARLYSWLVAFVLATLGLVAYRNSLDAPFVLDDERSIRDNPRIRDVWPSGEAGYAIQTSEAGRPVVRLSLAINYALGELELGDGATGRVAGAFGIGRGGTDVRGYHVFNLLVHVLSALLVFAIVRRTARLPNPALARLREAAPVLAPSTAALWLVHPLNTDAVTYVIQRTELLMGFFLLAMLLAAILALGSRRPQLWCAVAVLCCALGMGCKGSMAAAPILGVVHDRAYAFPSLRAALRARWPLYGGLAGTWVLLAFLIATGPRDQTVGLDLGVPWWRYAATQPGVILGYLRLAFWPDELCLDHGRALASTAGEIVPGAIVVGALVLATLWALFWRPALGFLGAWFFLILAPSSSVVPIVTEVAAERRMHMPLLAVVVLVVVGLHELARVASLRLGATRERALGVARAAVALATLVLAPVLTAVTVGRNADFESDLTIWEDTVAKRPDSFVARNNLARLGRKWTHVASRSYDVFTEGDARFAAEASLFMDLFREQFRTVAKYARHHQLAVPQVPQLDAYAFDITSHRLSSAATPF